MDRRLFVSAFSSAVALVASAFAPAPAAETPTGMPSIPEPDPITVDAATVDRARRTLDALAAGTIDRSQLAPQLSDVVGPEFFAKGAPYVQALGSPQSMYPFEKRILANDTSTFFRVKYPKEILTWVFSVDDQNRIIGVSLRRAPNNRIVSAVVRDVYY